MSVTKQKIKDGIVDAADAVKQAGKNAVEKVGEAATVVGEKAESVAAAVNEKGKQAAQATGEAIEKVGKKVRKQG